MWRHESRGCHYRRRFGEGSGQIPGGMEMMGKMTPVGRVGTGDDIAAACEYLCSDDAGFVTGANHRRQRRLVPVAGRRLRKRGVPGRERVRTRQVTQPTS